MKSQSLNEADIRFSRLGGLALPEIWRQLFGPLTAWRSKQLAWLGRLAGHSACNKEDIGWAD
jgi:hypothetical protein